MTAVAVALLFAGYTGLLYGWMLLQGYCITPRQLLSPSFPAHPLPVITGTPA